MRIRIPSRPFKRCHRRFPPFAFCAERKGEAKVLFDVERKDDFMVVMEAEGYNVLPDRNFIASVEELCGRGAVRVIE